MNNVPEIRKYGTFPTKPTPTKPMCHNKFQRVSAQFREQAKSGEFVHKKIHFGGTPRLKYREGGERFQKKIEKNGEKKTKNVKGNKRSQKEHAGKKNKNQKSKKAKGEPVKGTSTEYAQLANSDGEDDDDVIDVTDMLQKSDDDEEKEASEVPMINSTKTVKNSVETSKFSTGNRFNAIGEYEKEEPPKKKQKTEDSDDSDAPEAPEAPEDVAGESEESEDDDEAERLKFRAEMAQMPLGKVREMKEKLGIKLFNKTYFGTSEVEKKKKIEQKRQMRTTENGGQHRPKEISSKRPVSTFRNVYGEHEIGAKKKYAFLAVVHLFFEKAQNQHFKR
ncbi:unnamed protein product [Caenorhabditis sp. 36 PRJEB53466]|nr:unnamed protein product [Caenorhabditis sp. 36 PRJEB53466]